MSLLWVHAAKPIPTRAENIDRWHDQRPFYAPKPHEQTPEEFAADRDTMWHGSPNGVAGMKVAHYGVHVGTKQAAKEALEARIGRRADGKEWDGTQEYGKTLLAGYNHGYGHDAPDEPSYPTGNAEYSDRSKVPMDAKPHLFPVRIVGEMTNPGNPHQDWHANGYMQAQIKQGRARRGYYYENVGEDAGSVSAVVPNADHLATHEDLVRHAHSHGYNVPDHNRERYGL